MKPRGEGGRAFLGESELQGGVAGVFEGDGLLPNVLKPNRPEFDLLRGEAGLGQQHVVEEVLTPDNRLVGLCKELAVHTTRLWRKKTSYRTTDRVGIHLKNLKLTPILK